MGSFVRTTGSGLGCPDWPYCFGRLIPPTSEHELPENYRKDFSINGEKIAKFDPFKTWSEYLNRLLGVVVGIEMFLLLILSFKTKHLFPWCLIVFLLTGLQGWIGAKVVSTALHPQLISVHMLMAVMILLILHTLYVKTHKKAHPSTPLLWPSIVFFFSIVQLVLGTTLRQEIDDLVHLGENKLLSIPVENLGTVFLLHRVCASFVLIGNLVLFWVFLKSKTFFWPFGFLLITIAAGILLTTFAVPPILASIHLLASCLYLGTFFSFLLRTRPLSYMVCRRPSLSS